MTEEPAVPAKFDRSLDGKHIEWAEKVKKRDGFRCQICRNKGGYLHSHHKNSYAYYHNQRYDVNNGVTLCQICHDRFHNIYGNNVNTESQFQEFKQLTQALLDLERQKRDLPI